MEPAHRRLLLTTCRTPVASVRELRRRKGQLDAVDRPLRVIEAEQRHGSNQVHVRLVVRVEGTDVAPVTPLGLDESGYVVAREVVDLRLTGFGQRGDDIAAYVLELALAGGDDVDKRLRGEDVVAHRREHLVRVTGHRGWLGDLLVELQDLTRCGRLDDAKGRTLFAGHRDGGDRDPRAALDVVLHHLPRVHAVDVVGAETQTMSGSSSEIRFRFW